MAKESGEKVIATNRRARHDYLIEKTYEAGIVLTGTEVKSLRIGRVNLTDGYAFIEGGEVWLDAVQIPQYSHGNWTNHPPRRKRKLLLHKAEIVKISHAVSAGGYTLCRSSCTFSMAMPRSRSRSRRASASSTSARRFASVKTSAMPSARCARATE